MTVEQEVASLTTSVDSLTEAVNVKKSTLDASVTDSETARDQSQAARDTANDHKLAAEAAATDATNTATSISGFDLTAIAETKADTAVDVFVYDTSKDSDGGAWRKRTQGTSWYNETLNTATRGSRREFPAVAVIVAEADTVTIYDGDDPALPMWMVFEANGALGSNSNVFSDVSEITSVSCLNGEIAAATDNGGRAGLRRIRFLYDDTILHRTGADFNRYNGVIAERNDGLTYRPDSVVGVLVNTECNDVAMTVLPDAPIDPATGLPVPTIAVATDGGVSIIRDDGNVYDIYNADGLNEDVVVRFTPDGGPRWQDFYLFGNRLARVGINYPLGLSFVDRNPDEPAKGMVAYMTTTALSGWMPGDIKLAALSDTDDTDLVGSGELVTNGTFDTDTSGWTVDNNSVGNSATVVSGQVELDSTSGGAGSILQQTVGGLDASRTYVLTFDIVSASNLNMFLSSEGQSGYGAGSYSFTFTGLSAYLIDFKAPGSNTTAVVDNVSVKLADEDRSVNNNGLIVNGTITREPVATGADLVAYSGFSSSDYLEMPYNSDLDFGTGDFCIMGWVNTDGADVRSQVIFQRRSGGGNGLQLRIPFDGSGNSGLEINWRQWSSTAYSF